MCLLPGRVCASTAGTSNFEMLLRAAQRTNSATCILAPAGGTFVQGVGVRAASLSPGASIYLCVMQY